jgi:hypothetical protein
VYARSRQGTRIQLVGTPLLPTSAFRMHCSVTPAPGMSQICLPIQASACMFIRQGNFPDGMEVCDSGVVTVPGRRYSRISWPRYEEVQGIPPRSCRSRNHSHPAVTLVTCGALLEVTPGGVMAPILRGEGSQAPTCWGRPGSPVPGLLLLSQLREPRGVGRPQGCDGPALQCAVGVGPGTQGPRGTCSPPIPSG